MKIKIMKASKLLMNGAIILVGFASCSKNDDSTSSVQCFEGTWIQEISAETNAWITAAATYDTDPSTANCNSYKSAVTHYLDALDKIKKCVPEISLGEFNEAIDEARIELSDIGC